MARSWGRRREIQERTQFRGPLGGQQGTRRGDLRRLAQRALRLGFRGGAGGLELAQILDGAAEGALEGVAAALQAGEGLLGADKGSPVKAFRREGLVGATDLVPVFDFVELVFPSCSFGFAEAPEQPLGCR